jgi:hypothetical protein
MLWPIDESPPSDHRMIALYLSMEASAAADPIHYQDWRNADWSLIAKKNACRTGAALAPRGPR